MKLKFLARKLFSHRTMKTKVVTLVFCLAGMVSSLAQTLSVTNLVRENAVLQRNTNVNIWGKGRPGNTVTLKLGNGNNVTTTIAGNGKWMAKVPTGNAGGPYNLNIKDATKTFNFGGILLGEVWLCSGQSNMDMPLRGWGAGGTPTNSVQEIANANYPNIRMFKVNRKASYTPVDEVGGLWRVCNPNQAPLFSAVGYFFARELHTRMNIPIGIIVSSKGSSAGESWTSANSLTSVSGFGNVLADLQTASLTPNSGPYKISHINNDSEGFKTPGALYNGMIHPLIPYTIRGATWYQGESNTDNPAQYREILPALINTWKSKFNSADFPFYIAQIAPLKNYDYPASANKNTAELREAQFLATSIPNTGMAVLLDLGERTQIHPSNKQDVGKRLALWALAKQYGNNIAFSGPVYRSSEFKNGKGILQFDNAGGLKLTGGDNFEIAGANGAFVKANAVVRNGNIEVSANSVPNPTQARYAWTNWVVPTLYNGANLPSSSFRTSTSGVSNPPSGSGNEVTFKGQNINKFISSENGSKPITCSRAAAAGWEKFTVTTVAGGKVTIKGNNGLYISSENGLKPMNCNRATPAAWEEFTLVPQGGNVYAIKGSNGMYVSHENGSAAGMNCNRSAIGAWEKFVITGLSTARNSALIGETLGLYNQVQIVSNPDSANSVSLQLILNEDIQSSLKVMDLAGKVLAQRDFGLLKTGTFTVSLNEMIGSVKANGIYLVKVTMGENTVIKKFAK